MHTVIGKQGTEQTPEIRVTGTDQDGPQVHDPSQHVIAAWLKAIGNQALQRMARPHTNPLQARLPESPSHKNG